MDTLKKIKEIESAISSLDAETLRQIVRETLMVASENSTTFMYKRGEWFRVDDVLEAVDKILTAHNYANFLYDDEVDRIGEALIRENCKKGFSFLRSEITDYCSFAGIPTDKAPLYDFNSLFVTANELWCDHLCGKRTIEFAECCPSEYAKVSRCVEAASSLLDKGADYGIRRRWALQ